MSAHKPMLRIGPDDAAIINCGLCGDITDGVPVCGSCWSAPQSAMEVDVIIAMMPDDWPNGEQWRLAWLERRRAAGPVGRLP